jgi:hypothetical protein
LALYMGATQAVAMCNVFWKNKIRSLGGGGAV